MGPGGVAGLGATGRAGGSPQVRSVTGAAGPQLQADQRLQGRLRRSAGGPAAPQRLGQSRRCRHPLAGDLRNDLVDPALDEGKQVLQPREHLELLVGALRCEQGPGKGVAGVLEFAGRHRGVELALDGLLQGVRVDGDVPGVVLDQGEQLRAEPADRPEQALPGGLADGEEQQDVGRVGRESLGERLDVGGQQRHPWLLGQRQADVAGADHGGGEAAERLAHLRGEHAGERHAQHRLGSAHLARPVHQAAQGRRQRT